MAHRPETLAVHAGLERADSDGRGFSGVTLTDLERALAASK